MIDEEEGEEVCLCSLDRNEVCQMALCRKSKAVIISYKRPIEHGQCRQSRWQIGHSLALKNWGKDICSMLSSGHLHWACTTDMLINYAPIVTVDGYDFTDGNSGGNERGS